MKSINQRIAIFLNQKAHDNDRVILDIGCGPSKLNGSIGIDLLPSLEYQVCLVESVGFAFFICGFKTRPQQIEKS